MSAFSYRLRSYKTQSTILYLLIMKRKRTARMAEAMIAKNETAEAASKGFRATMKMFRALARATAIRVLIFACAFFFSFSLHQRWRTVNNENTSWWSATRMNSRNEEKRENKKIEIDFDFVVIVVPSIFCLHTILSQKLISIFICARFVSFAASTENNFIVRNFKEEEENRWVWFTFRYGNRLCLCVVVVLFFVFHFHCRQPIKFHLFNRVSFTF